MRWLAALALCGCAMGTQLAADPDDLADFRAFRAAAHPGRRLALAEEYLERHPNGAWAKEVRATFEPEEHAYYEAAQATRAKAFEYLTELPHGPHAAAARELLDAFDAHYERQAIEQLIKDARRTEALLDRAKDARRRVTQLLVAYVRVLLEPGNYGVSLADAPAPLRFALSGNARPTTGWAPRKREDNLFFTILSPRGNDPRAATLTLEVLLRAGNIVEARISGDDLFVRWVEAETNQALDASRADVREEAARHAEERLAALFEARLPQDRCAQEAPGQIILRSCDGWLATAWMGSRPGERDFISVAGPR